MKYSNLIKLEIIKAKSMRMLLILLLYFIISTSFFYFMGAVMRDAKITNFSENSFIEQNYLSAVSFFFVVLIINIGIDYNKKIYASQIVSGISKNDFIIGKFLFIILFAFAVVCVELVKFFIIQFFLFNQFNIDIEVLYKLSFVFFLLLLIIGSYAFVIVTIIKKTIIAIVVFYILTKIEDIINIYQSFYNKFPFIDYLPYTLTTNLIKNTILNIEHFFILMTYFFASIFFISYTLNKNEIKLNND